MKRIQVDFSNTSEEGLVFARPARATQALGVGDLVRAVDEEGHSCQARVRRIDDSLAYLSLDLATWDSTPESDLVRTTGAASSTSYQVGLTTGLPGDEDLVLAGSQTANWIRDPLVGS